MTTVQHRTAGAEKRSSAPSAEEILALSSPSSSASAALARSLFIYVGFMFRRPSKLFRPSRVDTFGGLRQLAVSANQTLSPSFIRTLLSSRSGLLAVLVTLFPPLVVNASLGFLLFTSHSFLALGLARIPFFQKKGSGDDDVPKEEISLQTLLQGPTIIPLHPTLLSSVAGAGAGVIQGVAFTPIDNVVRLLRDSASSATGILIRVLRLPIRLDSPLIATAQNTSTPLEAVRNFLSSDTWRKSAGWWSGWRWTVARDAVSYACFFAAFDISRRLGLRVKALFGGGIQRDWGNFVTLDFGTPSKDGQTPTIARVAQATTIVTGGVVASVTAEIAGRPFKACQAILQHAKTDPAAARHPLLHVLKSEGIRPFVRSTHPITALDPSLGIMRRTLRRAVFRLAAVGPWGAGFLVWAWVGGEI